LSVVGGECDAMVGDGVVRFHVEGQETVALRNNSNLKNKREVDVLSMQLKLRQTIAVAP
jgi:hypothetical protein